MRKSRKDKQRNGLPGKERLNSPGYDSCRISCTAIPMWKRASDITLVVLILPVVLVLAVAICLWIRLASRGDVLFKQKRIGRGGEEFILYKFRTMKHEADTAIHEAHVEKLIRSKRPMAKLDLRGDVRLIRGGRFIRMTGLDELPQLINIIKGEMTLVGPRPCTPFEFPFYDPADYIRFSLTPGLTGPWQVGRGITTTFREMVEMDVNYANHQSPSRDLLIIVKTPVSVLTQVASFVIHHFRHKTKNRMTRESRTKH